MADPESKAGEQQDGELERRVAERTRQLAALNDELEARNADLRAQLADRARTEDKLRISEAHLAEGQRLTRTGSWTWNVARGAVVWSEEHFHIFGFDPDAAEPSSALALDRVHPDDRATLDLVLAGAIAQRASYQHGFRIVLPDGTVKHLQSIGRPHVNPLGELEYVGTVMDVTERRQAEEALQNAQAELARVARATTVGELAASIAHEINQPLSAILTNSEAAMRWLARDAPDVKETRDALARIVRDARRAGDVVERIRALVKKAPPQIEAFDLNNAIDEVVTLTRGALQNDRVSVDTELPTLPPAHGDRVQLQQVVMNLILNGIEAMRAVQDRPRELRIRSRVGDANTLLVAVEDSGPGLDPAKSTRIFDPFFTTKPSGMGMGLSISRSIVEAHGGRLWASPRSPHGAVFQFSLPSVAS